MPKGKTARKKGVRKGTAGAAKAAAHGRAGKRVRPPRRRARKPPAPPVTVSKGAMLRRMDELARNREVMTAALRALEEQRSASIVDLGVLHSYVADNAEAEHVRRDWLAKDRGLEAALRDAFIEAARLAIEHDLPVDCYRVSGASRFAVAVLRSDRQITMLFFSPPLSAAKAGLIEQGIHVFTAAR